jgi:hypothetical protein
MLGLMQIRPSHISDLTEHAVRDRGDIEIVPRKNAVLKVTRDALGLQVPKL